MSQQQIKLDYKPTVVIVKDYLIRTWTLTFSKFILDAKLHLYRFVNVHENIALKGILYVCNCVRNSQMLQGLRARVQKDNFYKYMPVKTILIADI